MGGETLLLVVGAGASHDCLRHRPRGAVEIPVPGLPNEVADWTKLLPPLTKHLGQEGWLQNRLLTEYPDARPVVDELRDVTGSGQNPVPLERALAQYVAGADADPYRLRHVMAFRFYLSHMLWTCTEAMGSPHLGGGITNYTRLVRRLRSWALRTSNRVLAVSFNYDRLLELACEAEFRLPADPTKMASWEPTFALVKPHGSMNWAWSPPAWRSAIGMPWGPRDVIDRALELTDTHGLKFDELLPPPLPGAACGPLVPVMALPVETKQDLLWTPAQQQAVSDLHGSVTKMLVIGWRAAEAHFVEALKPLFAVSPRLLVVDLDEQAAHPAVRNLNATFPRGRSDWELELGGFRKWLDSDRPLDWLL